VRKQVAVEGGHGKKYLMQPPGKNARG
jgi:hypothetical protein